MKQNILKEKSYEFALNAIKVYKLLSKEQKEFILSKQFLRSATSIGANIQEADGTQSRKDFLYKVTISYKEAREAKYWLNLLKDSQYLNENYSNILLKNVEELLKIMGAIIITTKKNL
jgi:four helix bundle protein